MTNAAAKCPTAEVKSSKERLLAEEGNIGLALPSLVEGSLILLRLRTVNPLPLLGTAAILQQPPL